ncbi:TorS-related protein [Allostella vacuolata]|nr:TorS-related protein [Stella vacuolata]
MERFPLVDPSQVSVARREAVRIARACGFSEEDQARLAVVVTELSGNTVRHGGGGAMIFGQVRHGDDVCLQGLWLDRGRGMADPEACFRDGYSTGGTPGTGFGAAIRMSDGFDCYSRPGQGTVVLARLRADRASGPSIDGPLAGWAVGSIAVAKAGETVSGDAWAIRCDGPRVCCVVADGLGHGPQAADAAAMALARFLDAPICEPAAMLERIHLGMRSTRGGAVAVACIDPGRHSVSFCGVGNVAGALAARGLRRMVSMNGTAGGIASRIRAFEYPFEPPCVAILHSDGLSSQWTIDAYPGLLARDPAVIAGVVFRDHERGRDDATILVIKELAA